MGQEYWVVASPGGVRLRRKWVPTTVNEAARTGRPGRQDTNAVGVGRAGRIVTGFTPKARAQMRWVFNALPWGDPARLCMLTFTYPRDWRSACEDGATLKKHWRAFREAGRKKWGGLRGAWVLEFQERGAPHFHLYMALPDGAEISEDPTDDRLVWDWARKTWWRIVGSSDPAHRWWGVHYRPCLYAQYPGRRPAQVGEYFWRESGKTNQKTAPPGFEGCKWWDVWGMKPVEHDLQVSRGVYVETRRPVRQLRDKVCKKKVRRPNGLDGCMVTNVNGIDIATRLVTWAESEQPTESGDDPRAASSSAAERAAQRAAPGWRPEPG